MTEEKNSTLREHEKFWAFIILVGAILALALLAALLGEARGQQGMKVTQEQMVVLNAKLRIIDVSIAGLIGIAGMAAQALFRVSSTDKLAAEAALESAKKLPEPPPPPPAQVEVINTPEKPVPTEAAPPHAEPTEDDLPEYAR